MLDKGTSDYSNKIDTLDKHQIHIENKFYIEHSQVNMPRDNATINATQNNIVDISNMESLLKYFFKSLNVSDPRVKDKGLDVLENIIEQDNIMKYDFHSDYKEMSWYGCIEIFKAKSNENRQYDDRVPVQIKGHLDKNNKYLNNKKIKYRVSLDDLNKYFMDRGILYFQIFVSKDGKRKEVFYTSLYPTKIKAYLEKAKQKGNKKFIKIPFLKLEQSSKKLYEIVKQFSNESRKQGFGLGQIVQNTISFDDLDKIESLTATSVGATNEYEFFNSITNGDVCFYAKLKDNQIELPIEFKEELLFSISKDVNNQVFSNNKLYYSKYKYTINTEGEQILILSDNLKMNVSKGKFHFAEKGNIYSLKNDANFIFEVLEHKNIKIGSYNFNGVKFDIPQDLKERLDFYIDLYDVLNMININYSKSFENISISDIKALDELVCIKKGLKNNLLKEEITLYNWKIENKYMPIVIFKKDDEKENDLINEVYDPRCKSVCTLENGIKVDLPIFLNLDVCILSNLYYYNYDRFYEQIDSIKIDKHMVNLINDLSLRLIQVYDINSDIKFLELALYLLQKIETINDENIYTKINKFQIKKRLGSFYENEESILLYEKERVKDLDILWAINILLDEKDDAILNYKKLDKKTKEHLKQYPIYHLYEKLIK